MSKDRLRAQCLPPGADCSYVRVTVDGHYAGHACACRWKYGDKVVCWVTQLVVDRNHRERRLATGLLATLMRDTDNVYGIASSHPAACLAAARTFGRKYSNSTSSRLFHFSCPLFGPILPLPPWGFQISSIYIQADKKSQTASTESTSDSSAITPRPSLNPLRSTTSRTRRYTAPSSSPTTSATGPSHVSTRPSS